MTVGVRKHFSRNRVIRVSLPYLRFWYLSLCRNIPFSQKYPASRRINCEWLQRLVNRNINWNKPYLLCQRWLLCLINLALAISLLQNSLHTCNSDENCTRTLGKDGRGCVHQFLEATFERTESSLGDTSRNHFREFRMDEILGWLKTPLILSDARRRGASVIEYAVLGAILASRIGGLFLETHWKLFMSKGKYIDNCVRMCVCARYTAKSQCFLHRVNTSCTRLNHKAIDRSSNKTRANDLRTRRYFNVTPSGKMRMSIHTTTILALTGIVTRVSVCLSSFRQRIRSYEYLWMIIV